MADTTLNEQQNEQNQADSNSGSNQKAVPTGDGFSADLGLLMSRKGSTAKALADNMDIHISTVYYWLNRRTLPTCGMVFRIAKALKVEPILLYSCVTESDAYNLDRTNRKVKYSANPNAEKKEDTHA